RSGSFGVYCALAACKAHGGGHVSRAMVLDSLCGGYGCGQFSHQAEVARGISGSRLWRHRDPIGGSPTSVSTTGLLGGCCRSSFPNLERHLLVGSLGMHGKGSLSIWFFIGTLLT